MELTELNNLCKNTLISNLGIEFTDIKEDQLVAKMPVDERTRQPFHSLHGGAIMALAETVGSAGSRVILGDEPLEVVGLNISGNHISRAVHGFVTATGSLKHRGKRTHVWDIEVKDDENRIISVCRMTNMLIERK